MSFAWIKLHNNLAEHPKSDLLEIELGVARAWTHLVELWLWASRTKPDGRLTGLPTPIIAKRAGWTGDPDLFVSALQACGWLTEDLVLCGWDEHQGAHMQKLERDRERAKQRRASLRDGERPAAQPQQIAAPPRPEAPARPQPPPPPPQPPRAAPPDSGLFLQPDLEDEPATDDEAEHSTRSHSALPPVAAPPTLQRAGPKLPQVTEDLVRAVARASGTSLSSQDVEIAIREALAWQSGRAAAKYSGDLTAWLAASVRRFELRSGGARPTPPVESAEDEAARKRRYVERTAPSLIQQPDYWSGTEEVLEKLRAALPGIFGNPAAA